MTNTLAYYSMKLITGIFLVYHNKLECFGTDIFADVKKPILYESLVYIYGQIHVR